MTVVQLVARAALSVPATTSRHLYFSPHAFCFRPHVKCRGKGRRGGSPAAVIIEREGLCLWRRRMGWTRSSQCSTSSQSSSPSMQTTRTGTALRARTASCVCRSFARLALVQGIIHLQKASDQALFAPAAPQASLLSPPPGFQPPIALASVRQPPPTANRAPSPPAPPNASSAHEVCGWRTK